MVTSSNDTADSALEREPKRAEVPEVLVLVVAWSAHEPGRAGEIAVVPPPGASAVLGRGDEARLRFHRLRPGKIEPTAPLSSPGLSRRQLLLRSDDDGCTVSRVGRRVLEVDGKVDDHARLRDGMRLLVRGELLLLCVAQPALIPPLAYFPKDAVPRFGRADALGIVGESPACWRLREEIAFAARSGKHLLVTGPSGAGKELAARAVHALGPSPEGPFVARNAATLPLALVDAELYGHVRNYPNAGMPERHGLVGAADGGTLFLDEIGELPAEAQAHLLRVLDARGEYQRLGDVRTRTSRFRLVAATNRHPDALRPDLRARFPVVLDIEGLSARRGDVPLLVRHVLARIAAENPAVAKRFLEGEDDARVHPSLVEQLVAAPLRANARDVEAALWSAIAASTSDRLEPAPTPRNKLAPRKAGFGPDEIRAALEGRDGSIALAAEDLGLPNRFALYRLMKKHGLAPRGRR
jgi:two-component system response regulator HydG